MGKSVDITQSEKKELMMLILNAKPKDTPNLDHYFVRKILLAINEFNTKFIPKSYKIKQKLFSKRKSPVNFIRGTGKTIYEKFNLSEENVKTDARILLEVLSNKKYKDEDIINLIDNIPNLRFYVIKRFLESDWFEVFDEETVHKAIKSSNKK